MCMGPWEGLFWSLCWMLVQKTDLIYITLGSRGAGWKVQTLCDIFESPEPLLFHCRSMELIVIPRSFNPTCLVVLCIHSTSGSATIYVTYMYMYIHFVHWVACNHNKSLMAFPTAAPNPNPNLLPSSTPYYNPPPPSTMTQFRDTSRPT